MKENFPVYKVLVVDDEEMIRRLLVTILSKHGQDCEEAKDGFEALDKMKKSHFDAVITDIEMPKMNGVALTKTLLDEYPDLPIMIMTGFTRNHKIGTAIAAGARDFIKKPFSPAELIMRFKIMMSDQEIHSKTRAKRDTGSLDSMGQFQEKISSLKMQIETFRNKSVLSNDLVENNVSFASPETP